MRMKWESERQKNLKIGKLFAMRCPFPMHFLNRRERKTRCYVGFIMTSSTGISNVDKTTSSKTRNSTCCDGGFLVHNTTYLLLVNSFLQHPYCLCTTHAIFAILASSS